MHVWAHLHDLLLDQGNQPLSVRQINIEYYLILRSFLSKVTSAVLLIVEHEVFHKE